MKRISEILLEYARRRIDYVDEIKAKRVILGLGYTAVKLDTGHDGLCYTLHADTSIVCCESVKKAGTLAGRTAIELATLIKSWDLGERVIGTAAINSLAGLELQRKADQYDYMEGNMINRIQINRTDTVALVGNMRPIVPQIKNRANKVMVFERGGLIDEGVLPDTACEELLPEADVAIITGTTIANGTIDRVLELSSSARERVLVGPSASTMPEPLFERGVTAIGGIQIVDVERALKIIAEGGGTPQLRVAIKYVVLVPKR